MSTPSPTRFQTIGAAVLLSAGLALGSLWLADEHRVGAAVDELDATSDSDDADDAEPEYTTVRPEIQDLVIGHEAAGSIAAAATLTVSSPADGTVVSVVDAGATVSAGDVIAVVDDRPVAAIEGTVPMWRDLSVGDEGTDVEQLESALVALGFDPDGDVTIDEEYTSATAQLVADWQEAMGADETGSVGQHDVVVIGAPMIVGSVDVAVGSSVTAETSLLRLDSVDQLVTASIPISDAVTLNVGDTVELGLPDRTTLTGVVQTLTLRTDASIRVAEIAFVPPDSDETDETGDIDEAATARTFAGVSVDVSWDEIVATDAITIPADAFRHLDDGSYVLDILNADGTVSVLTVEPGITVSNVVEVASLPTDIDVIRL